MPKTGPFDRYSDAYDAWFEKNREGYSVELETIRRLIPPGRKGVEIGVGSGRFAAPLGISVGIEPSKQMAIKAAHRGIHVCLGVAEALPLSDNRFDFVLMVTTLCFLDDVLSSLKEAFRVLKSGGDIIVGFVDRDSELGRQYSRKRDRSRFYKEAGFLSAPEVLAYLRKVGFGIEKINQTLVPGQPRAILNGSGKGAFIGVRGTKTPNNQ